MTGIAGGPTAQAEDAAIAARRARQATSFTDAQIVDGFLKTAFGAEFHLAGRVDRIRRYDRPVRVFIDNRARPDRRAQTARVIADIGARIRHLDIAVTADREAANLVVTLVRDRDLGATIARVFGAERGREIRRALDPQCLSGFRKDEAFAIVAGDVILVADRGDFTFLDCAYEEILQALGPINDTDSVPWTMFNDRVRMGFFGVYDQILLNILYDPLIRPGMTVEEARAALPRALASARDWVARTNGLPAR
jgi:hypothetical protein